MFRCAHDERLFVHGLEWQNETKERNDKKPFGLWSSFFVVFESCAWERVWLCHITSFTVRKIESDETIGEFFLGWAIITVEFSKGYQTEKKRCGSTHICAYSTLLLAPAPCVCSSIREQLFGLAWTLPFSSSVRRFSSVVTTHKSPVSFFEMKLFRISIWQCHLGVRVDYWRHRWCGMISSMKPILIFVRHEYAIEQHRMRKFFIACHFIRLQLQR